MSWHMAYNYYYQIIALKGS
ncbi:hypothetical protein VTO73DRAFT_4238 [Trametes versicolor]